MSKAFDVQALDLTGTVSSTMIEANAGTGKTYNIQRLYRRFIETCGYKTSEILVVTFTEAATAELRSRIRAELADAVEKAGGEAQGSEINNLRMALSAFDEATIFTIHGFCKRALSEFAFESGASFDCELNPDMHSMLQEAVDDFYRSRLSRDCAPAVDLKTLRNFAAIAMKQPQPVVETALEEDAAYQIVCKLIKDTTPPKRKSGFKDALEQATVFLEEPQDHDSLKQMIESGKLSDATAKKNAEELVAAIIAYQDALKNRTLYELLEFLNDEKSGIEARKQRAQMMGFDDLLVRMRDAMGGNSDSALAKMLRKTYKVALVDEFQDTDPVQYEIFNTAFNVEGSQLFMIGDPKQAIYAFRGGDIYAYLDARKRVPAEHRYTLTNNYRSSRELIESVNRFFEPPRSFLENLIEYHPSGFGDKSRPQLLRNGVAIDKPFKLVWFRGDDEDKPVSKSNVEADFLSEAVEQIVELLMDEELAFDEKDRPLRRIQPKDIAVLVDTNLQCGKIKRYLASRGVMAVIYKSGNVFKSQDATDLYHILSAILNPSQVREVRAALLSGWGGKSVAEIDQWKSDEGALAEVSEKFQQLHSEWRKHGVFRALARFMKVFNGFSNVAKQEDCERRLTNYRQLVEILNAEERRAMLHPEGLLRFLQNQISDPDLKSEEYEERLESDRLAVTIMTIHKSKGLQFPIVVCPTLSLSTNVSGRKESFDTVHQVDGQIYLPISVAAKIEYKDRIAWEKLSEKIRQLYVAMTRAANYCILLAGNVKHQKGENAFNYLGKIREGTLGFGSPEAPVLTELEVPGKAQPFGDIAEVVERTESTLGASSGVRFQGAEQAPELEAPASCPRVENSFSVMSYSSMVLHGSGLAQSGHDEGAATDVIGSALPLPDPLPRGKNMGLCMHEIFERIDFGDPSTWSEQIEWMAERNQYNLFSRDIDARKERMQDMFSSVVNRTLADDFSLASIPLHDTKHEWSFYFPVPETIDLAPFEKIGLSFSSSADKRKGFMIGFVDLLFRKGGRYYYADWKTDALPDYSAAYLKDTMLRTGYLFQSIVYGVALYEHLRLTLGHEFSYEKHFGGGYYFFVRGVDAERGVFSHRPGEEELREWRRVLKF
ncbi:MAG: UvrD-helicase domain-containing protein [Kiritimatiellae bacterium]|nr:UvrD-helicase domain-containing protein [Kiritimatiellia bacterium]